jgi:diguanylate cyclase (GGDEF)-like protein
MNVQNQRKMLVVDDSFVNRKIIANIFKNEFLIEEAENGRQALDAIGQKDISIAVLDLMMPVMDGFEVLRRLRQNPDPEISRTPVIVVTAANDYETEVKALDCGADDYIVKPVNPTITAKRVHNAVSRHELEEQRLIDQQLLQKQELESRLISLIDVVSCGIILIQVSQESGSIKVSYMNKRIQDTLANSDLAINNVDENVLRRMVYSFDRAKADELIRLARNGEPSMHAVLRCTRGYDSDLIWVRLEGSIYAQDGEAWTYLLTLTDVTQEEENAAELRYRANYDSVTGIYNETSFYAGTEHLLETHAGEIFAIVRFNIEDFRLINTLYGRTYGNNILRQIAMTLEGEIGETGVYGRLEADHFAACVPYDKIRIEHLCQTINANLNRIDERHKTVVDAGVCVVSDNDSLTAPQMCMRANLALTMNPGRYESTIAYYDNALTRQLMQKQEIRNDMEQALENHEFEVWYQPVIQARLGTVASAEALVRWNHPKKGRLSPSLFIPLFEETGFISRIDRYMWENVCIYLKKRTESGLQPVCISVNASRKTLYNPYLADELTKVADTYGVDHSLIRLEITESAYNDNPKQLVDTVRQLRENGFLVLMDDFGSGYSSFNTLKDIPLDILKIDLKFLENFETNPRSGAILTSIIKMAHWIGLKVVAEGVEDLGQSIFLKSVGCDMFQGFYYSKPLDEKTFNAFLADRQKPGLEPPNVLEEKPLDIRRLLGDDPVFTRMLNASFGASGFYQLSDDRMDRLRVSERYYQELGYQDGDPAEEPENITQMILPEDRQYFLETILQSQKDGRPTEGTVRRKGADDIYLPLSFRVQYLGTAQAPCFFFNFHREMKKIEVDPQVSGLKDQLSGLVRFILKSSAAVIRFELGTRDFDFLVRTDQYDEMLYDPQEYYGENGATDKVYQDDRIIVSRAMHEEFLKSEMKNHHEDFVNQVRLKGRSGDWIWVEVHEHLWTEDNHSYGLLYLKLIDREKKKEAQLEKKASFDALTGLYNRETLTSIVSGRMASSRMRSGTVVMMDVDGFKDFNDRYGHAVGDAVLKSIADLFRGNRLPGEIVGRYGGDEFVMYLESDLETVKTHVRRIQEKVKAITAGQHEEEQITISAGIAERTEGETFEEVFFRADAAMYRAKKEQRGGIAADTGKKGDLKND